MYFSWSPRKVPKEGDLRRRYENAPSLRIHPPHRHPYPENVPIFGRLPRANLQGLRCRCSKIGTFLDTDWRCGGGYQRGRIFVAPLWPLSLVTFLAAQESNITVLTIKCNYLLSSSSSWRTFFLPKVMVLPSSITRQGTLMTLYWSRSAGK